MAEQISINKPDYFLTKEEIANELWKGLDDNTNRISQIIKRLRSALASIPEIEIKNIPRVGFRLILH
ncbi:helix-turn-helix domain-containing protein [Massilibacteroides sp.]|uniref:winged helix-turn-helix domain-containing protein n=1 Tax=Massilibacteroides sp. TaxID=2034766 RepID=UPI00261DFD4F|nr:helix-turn-helix domain-containing protein [Massilibacteroides sp.]MDD4515702.1 helix-turn-helix domain-containing protein [Massilibacteroides sp.]